MGYIGTEKEYGNYHIRLPVPLGRPRNSSRGTQLKRDAGFYYHITRPRRRLAAVAPVPDPADRRGRPDRPLRRPARHLDRPRERATPTCQPIWTAGARRQAARPRRQGHRLPEAAARRLEVDGWNTAEVIARGDSTVHILNGQVVNQGKKHPARRPQGPDETTARHPRPHRAGDRGGGDLVPERGDPLARRVRRAWQTQVSRQSVKVRRP